MESRESVTAQQFGDFVAGLRLLLRDPDATWSVPASLGDGVLEAAAARHRVTGVLRAHLSRIVTEPSTLTSLRRRGDRLTVTALGQAGALRDLADVLESAGVPFLAIKGVAVAVQTTGQVAGRASSDIDLVVAPHDVGRALVALDTAGWSSVDLSRPEPSPSWVWRYHLATAYETQFTRAGHRLDLHWRLSPSVGDLPDFGALWSAREMDDIVGRQVPTLGRPDALRYLCSNAAKDRWTWLRNLVDIHLLDDVAPPSMTRRQRRSLELTRGLFGDEPSLEAVRRAHDAGSHPIRRATRRHDPGATWDGVRRRVALHPTPVNLGRTLAQVLVGGQHLVGREQQRPLRAWPAALATHVVEVQRGLHSARVDRASAHRDPG